MYSRAEESSMENHNMRPEIQAAYLKGAGSSCKGIFHYGLKYFYHARYFNGYYVRTSLVYDISARQMLKPTFYFFCL
jgi:hypothetical protein